MHTLRTDGVITKIRTLAGCGTGKVVVACDTQKKGTMEEAILGIRIIRVHRLDIILDIFGQ